MIEARIKGKKLNGLNIEKINKYNKQSIMIHRKMMNDAVDHKGNKEIKTMPLKKLHILKLIMK